jgi:GT2 family glycosyltransferase
VAPTRVGLLLSGPVTYLDEGVLPADDADPRWFAEHRSPHPARPDPPYDEVVTGAEPDLFWSLSFAVTAPTWQRLGGFHEGYEGYGGEDTDLGWTARDRGVELAWLGGADAFHQHHPVSQPPVEHLEDILRNGAVFARRWGRWPMEGWLRELAGLGLVEHVDGEWRATREREELHA